LVILDFGVSQCSLSVFGLRLVDFLMGEAKAVASSTQCKFVSKHR
jgi:hypothetical protein